jgi:hypothetical protein
VKEQMLRHKYKHHPAIHRQLMRPLILNNPKTISMLAEAIKKKPMTAKAA